MKEIIVSSLLGMDSGKPIVAIKSPKGEEIQLETRDARAVALNILAAAEAADQDYCLYRFLTEILRSTHDESAGLIGDLRHFRKDLGESVPGSGPVEGTDA